MNKRTIANRILEGKERKEQSQTESLRKKKEKTRILEENS
jgi:hypothetical protein